MIPLYNGKDQFLPVNSHREEGMFLVEKACHLSYIIIWVGLILEKILNHQGHEGAQGKTL
jgi:hypothetical protein